MIWRSFIYLFIYFYFILFYQKYVFEKTLSVWQKLRNVFKIFEKLFIVIFFFETLYKWFF